MCGDKNKMLIKDLLEIDSSLKQIVDKPTRGDNILDIVLTNVSSFYNPVEILPPLQPDRVGQGVESDHKGVLATPKAQSVCKNIKMVKFIRTFPESAINTFGSEFVHVNWDFLDTYENPTEMASKFEETVDIFVSKHFPMKQITVSTFDKPYFTEELRKLRRKRQTIYRRYGKSEKYFEIKSMFDMKLQNEKQKYCDKILREVREGKRGSSYSALKKMSLHCNQSVKNEFVLPEHQSLNMSPLQCAEKIGDYFVQISREFQPLSVESLPQRLREYLLSSDQDIIPILSDYDVYQKIRQSKKPNSTVGCDIPVKIVKTFSVEL